SANDRNEAVSSVVNIWAYTFWIIKKLLVLLKRTVLKVILTNNRTKGYFATISEILDPTLF
ncbi:MAG: hypothetical protein WBM37_14330, partial [Nitrososphaeraceae archaeon]